MHIIRLAVISRPNKKGLIIAYEREPDGYVSSWYANKQIQRSLLENSTLPSVREAIGVVKKFIKNNGYKITKGTIKKHQSYVYELQKVN